jgi:hydroxymethylglutaryl-CoA synthase
MKIGIDRLSFFTSRHYLDLAILANARGIDVNKFYVGLGQKKMSVPAPCEDTVTLGANAAQQALKNIPKDTINTLLFATETGIDQSKAAGIYLKRLLDLPSQVRVVELKQACYSATAALQMAVAMVQRQPEKKILIVASDISRYGLNTTGESSQGCGAVAMVISANPSIMAIEPHAGLYTEDVMDFWRPNYRDEALVEGHYSTKIYLKALEATWQHYQTQAKLDFSDFAYFCFHNPVPRLVEKAYLSLAKLNQSGKTREEAHTIMQPALFYGQESGNSYSAALYVSLASLLDGASEDLTDQRIGMYSYGSGCVAEFFSGIVQPGYKKALDTVFHSALLRDRQALTYQEYESFYSFRLPQNGGECRTPRYPSGHFVLTGIKDHQRLYEKRPEYKARLAITIKDHVIQAQSPGKLILSGEHSVVYGKPALAMAINRYVKTTASAQTTAEDVSMSLQTYGYKDSFTYKTLKEMKRKIKKKYKEFLQGELSIREVLQAPIELTQFAVSSLFERFSASPEEGLHIETTSTIPAGCGMGSSAASVLSVLKAVSSYYQLHWGEEDLLRLAHETESLQHGKSSGIDLHVSLLGGCVYFHDQRIEKRTISSIPMYLVNTGSPQSSTGECGAYVKEHFAEDGIWDTFETVTNLMDHALLANDVEETKQAVRDNHQLLVKIGVVPLKVQQFIADLEVLGHAAKICGAGSVKGDQAGAVMVVAEDTDQLTAVCERYHYDWTPVVAEERGVHVV